MSVAVRVFGVRLHSHSLIRICTVAATAMTLGACSADSSRFDAGFGFGTDMSGDGMTTASLRPSEPLNGAGPAPTSYGAAPYGGTDQQSYAAAPSQPPAHASFQRMPSQQQPPRVERVALAPVSPPAVQPAPQAEPAVYRPAAAPIAEPAKPAPTKTVAVKSGDTLISIARRQDVSVDDIMAANNMTSTRLSIDQVLKIPSSGGAATQMATARTHKVRDGESIYIIADRYNVNYRELATHNDLKRPQLIRPGQTLKIPGGGETQIASEAPKPKSEGVRVVRTRTIPASPTKPEPEPVRVASADPNIPIPQSSPSRAASPESQTEAAKPVRTANLTSPAPMSGTEFRWPVRGRVISKFGSQPNGKHNDGINLAVPLGTAVKAAENGVVAYAGNELEGYGNLILIRHSNGWVSAYAHNSELLVKRGDTVTRGQVVAKTGQSGSVDQPQLHFELRKGSKPVDPMGHMAEM